VPNWLIYSQFSENISKQEIFVRAFGSDIVSFSLDLFRDKMVAVPSTFVIMSPNSFGSNPELALLLDVEFELFQRHL
jgi:hypothetical protein